MTIRSARRAALATLTALIALSVVVTPAPAFAKAKKAGGAASTAPVKKKSVALGPIEGKKNSEVRGWVKSALQANFEFTDAEDFKTKGDDAGFMKMAAELGVEAVIVGKADKNHLLLTVHDGADGRVTAKIDLKAPPGPKLKAMIDKRLATKLYATFGLESPADAAKKKAEAKQEAEEASAEEEGGDADGDKEKADDSEPAEDSSSDSDSDAKSDEDDGEKKSETPSPNTGSSVLTPFEAALGLGFSKRSFKFNDTLSTLTPNRPLSRTLRDYNSGVDVSFFLRGELYPAGLAGADGFASNLGLYGGFEYGIPSKIVYRPQGGPQSTLKNSVQEWFVGLKARVPIGAKAALGFSWIYGSQKYYLTGDENNALVPDVVYSYTGPVVDARLGLGRVFLQGRVGARLILDSGQLEDPKLWFNNVGGRGLEGALTVGFDVTPSIFVFGSGRFLRYGFDFNPNPPNAFWVAGGATDQFMAGSLGVGYHMPGTASAVAASSGE
jgi:hypothetical protein